MSSRSNTRTDLNHPHKELQLHELSTVHVLSQLSYKKQVDIYIFAPLFSSQVFSTDPSDAKAKATAIGRTTSGSTSPRMSKLVWLNGLMCFLLVGFPY